MNGEDREDGPTTDPWPSRQPGEPATVGDSSNGADRLLDTEDPTTTSVVVAARWIRVYTDLLRAKESLMTDLGGSIARSGPEAAVELARADGDYFAAQRARYQRRLSFWVQRKDHLANKVG